MRKPLSNAGARARRWIGLGIALFIAFCAFAFAPSALGSLTASREEKRVLEQAAVDSFPSPEDVGLDQDKAQP